jgi:hypothetical protein
MGQLAFFIQYLKIGHRFMPWVEECPLRYTSPNAPKKINVLKYVFAPLQVFW